MVLTRATYLYYIYRLTPSARTSLLLAPSISSFSSASPLPTQSAQECREVRGRRSKEQGQEMAEAKSSVSVEEEAYVEKKFGGITPKKPLISKDHERAYFDSADWVLGKQAASSSTSRAAVESLKPKLKRTPHHQLPPRKPACASG
uniref:Uncharacterized protein n=1 Tax=Avena sativa TaxID=4498 RepID=A0ACD5XKR9_AVESA